MPAALLNGQIYVTGGFGDGRVVLATVEVFDPQANAWSSAPEMPGPRHHHGTAAVNGKLYIIGGYSTLGTVWQIERTLFEFDPVTQIWSTRAALPEPRGAMAVASWEGKIYVFGGEAGRQEKRNTYIYDPLTDTWSEGAPMPTAREHVLAAALGSTIYVAGGRTILGLNSLSVEGYSPQNDTWRTLQPMNVARSGHGLSTLGGKLYAFGGENLISRTVLSEVEEYDPETNRWRRVASLPSPLTGPGVVGLTNKIHVLGGSNEHNDTQARNLVFSLP